MWILECDGDFLQGLESQMFSLRDLLRQNRRETIMAQARSTVPLWQSEEGWRYAKIFQLTIQTDHLQSASLSSTSLSRGSTSSLKLRKLKKETE